MYVRIKSEYVGLCCVILWYNWTNYPTLTVERELSSDFCSSEVGVEFMLMGEGSISMVVDVLS